MVRCLLALLAFSSLLAAKDEFPGDNKIVFLLPVNWTVNPEYTLEVTIPKGYTSIQPFKEWEQASLIEFIPNGESKDRWTEIITVNKFIGEKIPADTFVKALKERLVSQIQNTQFYQEDIEKTPNYTRGALLLSYDFQGKHEVMGAVYYSEPYDCAGVQYTLRIGKKLSESQALEKIKDFNHSVRMISPQEE